MDIIWSHVSLAEPTETVALGVRETRTRRREVGEETHRTWLLGMARGREVLVVFICHLITEYQMKGLWIHNYKEETIQSAGFLKQLLPSWAKGTLINPNLQSLLCGLTPSCSNSFLVLTPSCLTNLVVTHSQRRQCRSHMCLHEVRKHQHSTQFCR